MKTNILNFLLILVTSSLSAQTLDRQKAEKLVQEYLKAQHNDYQPHSFGEFFEQHDVEDLQREINTTETIAFSLVHSYKLGDKVIKNEYFHFDKNYNILGQISFDRMMELSIADLKGLFADTTFVNKLKNVNTPDTAPSKPGELDMAEGLAYMMMEKYKQAIASFTSSLKADPDQAVIYFYRGQCYEKLKKKDLACDDFKNSKKLGYVDIELDEKLKACK